MSVLSITVGFLSSGFIITKARKFYTNIVIFIANAGIVDIAALYSGKAFQLAYNEINFNQIPKKNIKPKHNWSKIQFVWYEQIKHANETIKMDKITAIL